MDILIIIDVQTGYAEGNEVIGLPCSRLANTAIKLGIPVFCVEYIGWGETDHRILRRLVNYDKAVFLKKDQMDGSNKIQAACTDLGIEPKIFHICGLYTSDCVEETVFGLLSKFKQSKVRMYEWALYNAFRAISYDLINHPGIKIVKKGQLCAQSS